ncbi:putative restriction endonuclease [Bradyrhizobium sp. WSM471]|nr:putative restriction endonuclease [Bradyrhizobium sp. WSM471]
MWRGPDGWFDTTKPKLPQRGDILWCFEGEGRPAQFRLVKRAVVSHSKKGRDGSKVHFDTSLLVDALVNDLPWFAELRRSQFFSQGVIQIRNEETIGGLEQLAATRGLRPDLAGRLAARSQADDLAEIENDATISETERAALTLARLGQGAFREKLDELWGHACAVTGCSIRELLRASHIKPWCKSDHGERRDPDNGLLLVANIDILFDKGFISFDDNGRMLISSKLTAAQRRMLGLPGPLKRRPTLSQRRYLAYHREVFGFPS